MSKYLAITGEINTSTYSNALRFVEETLKEGTKDIVIIINSTGGSVDNGFAIYDLIKSINYLHITTIAIGTCASIATIGSVTIVLSTKIINRFVKETGILLPIIILPISDI